MHPFLSRAEEKRKGGEKRGGGEKIMTFLILLFLFSSEREKRRGEILKNILFEHFFGIWSILTVDHV